MKHHYYRLGLLVALWSLVQLALGQGLSLTGLNPVRNARSAPQTTNVVLTFTQSLSNTAATLNGLRVFSAQRGGLLRNGPGGTASVSGSTFTFNPATNFKPGETVFATSTTAIQGTGGARLSRGQVYQFTTGVGGTGRGNFTPPATNPTTGVGTRPQSIAVGDVDGDGDLDLLIANRRTTSVSVRLNNGSGNFTPPAINPNPVVETPTSVVLGDVDGDGDLDFVTTNVSNARLSVRLNDGTGNFTPHPTNPSPLVGREPSRAAFGDVDGDGDLDLVVANSESSYLSILFNDGTGNFNTLTNNLEILVGANPQSIAVGDVDGDGDLDLLIAISGSNRVSVRLNDGTGNFTPPATNPEVGVGIYPNGEAVGDVDGDGDLDLLTSNAASNNVSIRLNDGTGIFTPPASNPEVGVGSSPAGVALGDVDGDGDLDFITACANFVSVRLNDGSGNFTPPAFNPDPEAGSSPANAAFGDVDGDGDLDLLCGSFDTPIVSVRLNGPIPLTLTGLSASPNPVCAGQPLSVTASVGNLATSYSYTLSNGTTTTTTGTATTPAFSRSLTAGGSGVQSFTLTVSSQGQVVTATTSVTVNAAPTASLLSSGPLSCAVTSVILTASGGTSYTFTSPGGAVLGTSGATTTRTVSSPGTYSVRVGNASGCVSTTSTSVVSTTAVITTNNPATSTVNLNAPLSQSFTASGGVAPYRFSLASGSLPTGLSLSTAGVLSGTPTQAGSFTLVVRGTDANGCSGLSPGYVLTVNATPIITGFNTLNNPVCVGSPISFTASVGNVTGSYNFTLTNGGSSTISTASGSGFSQDLTASGNGAQSFTLTVGDNGFQATATTNVTINALPTAGLTSNGPLTCSVTSVTLTASGGSSYTFTSPGGGVLAGSGNTRVVSTPGAYSVRVGTAGGCTSVASVSVAQDNTAPVATLVSSGSLSCSVTSVTLTASPTGQTYTFNGPGIVSATGTAAVVNAAGTYSATVVSANGCSSVASVSVAQDNAAPVASLVSSGSLTCSVTSVTLTASPGGQTYVFSSGASQIGSTNQAVVSTSGPYSVSVLSANGCSSVASVSVAQDNATPVATLVSSGSLSCSVSSVTLTATPTGQTYTFSGPGIVSRIGNMAVVNASGTYSVSVVSGNNGCTSVASTSVSQDNTTPTVRINPTSATLSCASPSVSLTAIGTGSVRWSTGATTPIISVNSAGPYSVTLTATNGCSAVASVNVGQDNTAPVASLVSSGSLSCSVTSLTLTASPDGQSYTFSNGASQIGTSNQAVVNASGSYSVTVLSANGCSAVASVSVSADQSAPSVSITPLSATLSCTSPSVSLTAIGTGSVRWSTGSTSPILTVNSAGTYSVTLTAGNGCSAVASAVVSQQPDQTIAFTRQPASASSVTVGTDVATAVSVSGSPTGFQWFRDNNPVGGQTTATLTLTNVQLTDAGNYRVVVSGICNSLTSTAFSLAVNPLPTAPFAITAVTTVSCTPILPNRFSVSFTPRYSGLNGQPVSFSVANELLPTTESGPYTLQLYTDNPTLVLQATQGGSPPQASFAYHWLAACQTTEAPNTPPRVVSALSSQTATAGIYFTYVIPDGTFTDTETPLSLRLSASGLPTGLSFAGATLSGVPSSTIGSPFSLTITATDPGGLSVSTPLLLTVLPATTSPPPTAPFALTGVSTLSCTPVADRININFAPRYGGMTGQPIAFEVVNELAPTTDPAPYSLTLYRDNPVLTLKATQTGSAEVASFSYNWLAACALVGQDNTPPRVNSPVGNQTAVVGQGYSLNLSNTFADQETPTQLTLVASGLPAGLSLVGSQLSGTPSVSGVSTMVLTASDPGSLTASTSFVLVVSPAASQTTTPPPTGFAITSVQTLSCVTLGGGQRSVSFVPQYEGTTGQAITFSVANELAPTTTTGPYTLRLYTDNPVITLRATQGGSAGEVSYRYNWLAACGSSTRVGVAEPASGWQVRVLGNPVAGQTAEIEISGAEGQAVQLQLVDLQGRLLHTQRIASAGALERASLPLGTSQGVLLLRVNTLTQHQQVKLLRTN